MTWVVNSRIHHGARPITRHRGVVAAEVTGRAPQGILRGEVDA